MALSKERKGEIAVSLLKHLTKTEDLRLNSLKRELGNRAAAIGVPIDELKEFAKLMIAEATEEALRSEVSDERD